MGYKALLYNITWSVKFSIVLPCFLYMFFNREILKNMLTHFVNNLVYVFCFNCTKLHLNTYNIIVVSINKKIIIIHFTLEPL